MMALFLHFFYTTYVVSKRSRRVAAANDQMKPVAMTSSNGHFIDSRNGDPRKPLEADLVQNNNSVIDASRERKEQ